MSTYGPKNAQGGGCRQMPLVHGIERQTDEVASEFKESSVRHIRYKVYISSVRQHSCRRHKGENFFFFFFCRRLQVGSGDVARQSIPLLFYRMLMNAT